MGTGAAEAGAEAGAGAGAGGTEAEGAAGMGGAEADGAVAVWFDGMNEWSLDWLVSRFLSLAHTRRGHSSFDLDSFPAWSSLTTCMM